MTLRAALSLCAALWLPNALAASDPSTANAREFDAVAPAQTASPPGDLPIPQDQAEPAKAVPPLPSVELTEPVASGQPIDLTAEHDELWARIRRGFSMTDLDNDLVRRHEFWYRKQPEFLRRVVERSRPYMHHIVEEIEKRGLPTELALLPIVESAYNPMALSRARASGLWQFIPSTGKNYQLKQNWWVDERRDIVASTDAALDYLKYIYELHGDWHLALASYNWGEGAVGRAIAKNRAKKLPTDYSSLKMPRETQNYVPKLQALKNLLADPEQWAALQIPEIPNKAYFSAIPKPADMDIKVAARLAEMPIDEFVALNPAHNRPLIKSDLPLLLPADKVATFQSNLGEHDDPLSYWQSYTFRKTDQLDKVASKFGISLAQLKTVNGLNGRKARVMPGQDLLVPVTHDSEARDLGGFKVPVLEPTRPVRAKKAKGTKRAKPNAATVQTAKTGKPAAKKATRTIRYTVKKGDTLSSIARKFNTSANDIAARNAAKGIIKPGQQLQVSSPD